MKVQPRRLLVVAIPALLLVQGAGAHDVVVFGDSWAEGAADELADVLVQQGHPEITVDPQGVGGTTAEYWADTLPDALPAAVSANPDARWVWLSIGGNDTFGHYAAGDGAQNAADLDTHLRIMLDQLYASHPDIRVVMFGYDFVNFEQSPECILTAFTYFGDGVTSQLVNQVFLDDVGATLQALAADYPHFTYVDSVWGTLQAAGGVPGAPNVLLPSPAEYFADCIHPTHEGYLLIHDALYDGYWGLETFAAFTPGQTEFTVGDVVEFTSTSTNVRGQEWYVDGQLEGAGTSLELEFLEPGPVHLELKVRGIAWDAAVEADLNVTEAADDDDDSAGDDDTSVDDDDDTAADDDTAGDDDSAAPPDGGDCSCQLSPSLNPPGIAVMLALLLIGESRRRRTP